MRAHQDRFVLDSRFLLCVWFFLKDHVGRLYSFLQNKCRTVVLLLKSDYKAVFLPFSLKILIPTDPM